jgi:anti-sigma B factor antagonist
VNRVECARTVATSGACTYAAGVDLTITPRTDSESRTCLLLDGSLDLESRDGFLERARAELSKGGAGLVLDLSGVTFMDSSGLNALITLSREGEDAGFPTVLHAPSARVMRLLETTGLQKLWKITS